MALSSTACRTTARTLRPGTTTLTTIVQPIRTQEHHPKTITLTVSQPIRNQEHQPGTTTLAVAQPIRSQGHRPGHNHALISRATDQEPGTPDSQAQARRNSQPLLREKSTNNILFCEEGEERIAVLIIRRLRITHYALYPPHGTHAHTHKKKHGARGPARAPHAQTRSI